MRGTTSLTSFTSLTHARDSSFRKYSDRGSQQHFGLFGKTLIPSWKSHGKLVNSQQLPSTVLMNFYLQPIDQGWTTVRLNSIPGASPALLKIHDKEVFPKQSVKCTSSNKHMLIHKRIHTIMCTLLEKQ
ncbi:Hypothetical predicted protein [Xyrichtys novacula]|uniref:Uncharacterized protein n=1 Tax=Xyrichtys novacula TaxID=13765 RepID=A0AAV1EK31_XYRNO|nr:Hypothetical predicted protein [Xyrichtys novacula]